MIIGVDLRCLNEKITSGVSVYTFNLLKNLLLLDNKNYYKIFTNRQNVEKLFSDLPSSNFKFFNYNIPNKLLNTLLKFFNYPKIDKLIGGADIFWLPNINFINLSPKCKLITTVHDLSYLIMPELYSLRGKLWHLLINPKKIFTESKALISVSKNTKSDLIKYFNLSDKKIHTIYPGIEDTFQKDYYSAHFKSVKQKYQISENFILTVATLEPRKNIESVILAFEMLLDKNPNLLKNNWQLVIIGKRGWLDKTIFKLFKQTKYQKQIKFLNNIPRQQLAKFYQSAKVFIWPSYYEGFGFPPLEAMKSNLSIITSFNSSLTEILGNNLIYINPFNLNELLKALEITIKNKNFRQGCQTNCNSANNFNWGNATINLLNILNQL